MGKEQAKRAKRLTQSRVVHETDPGTKTTDRQISEVRNTTVRKDGSVPFTGFPSLPTGTPSGTQPVSKAFADDNYAFWPHDHEGESWVNDHSHSQYITENYHNNQLHSYTRYMKYPKHERDAMLQVRSSVRAIADRTDDPAIEELAAGIELALRLHMDYRNFDAFERERRFDDSKWERWTKAYKETFEVDEHFEQVLPHTVATSDERKVKKDHWTAIRFVEDEE
jgi:hypothetical protein